MKTLRCCLWYFSPVELVVLALLTPLVLLLDACAGGLAPTTPKNLEHAVRLTGASYAHQDAGTAGAALIREAHCDLQAVLRDEKLPAVDAGVPCE